MRKKGHGTRGNSPSSPDSMDTHSLGNIDDKLDIRIVIIICTTGDLYGMKINQGDTESN